MNVQKYLTDSSPIVKINRTKIQPRDCASLRLTSVRDPSEFSERVCRLLSQHYWAGVILLSWFQIVYITSFPMLDSFFWVYSASDRGGISSSINMDGRWSVPVYLLLVLLTLHSGVTEAKKKNKPKGVTVIDDLTQGETCDKERYYCSETCEPEDPDDPFSPDEPKAFSENPDYPLWASYVEIISTTATPVTLYLNENNDVTTNLGIQFDTPFTVSGTDLWEVSLWFSKYKDGSGKTRTNLLEETLSQKQKDKSVKPNKLFNYFELDQNVDLSDGTGCGKYKYICGEIRKNNPNPDFQLIERHRLSPRGCAQVTCKERGNDDPKTVQFDSVQPTPVELTIGERNKVSTDVTVTFNQENTDPDTAGEALWQMSVWFSKDDDGFGKATGLVESALTDEQGSKPVDNFNEFILEDLQLKADLRDAIGCGKYKYVCAQIRKDSPVPDYEQVGKSRASTVGCAPVTCRTPDGEDVPPEDDDDDEEEPFPPPPDAADDPIIEVVSTSTTPVTLYLDEVNDVTTDVAVVFDTDEYIKGTDLWEMSIWFSKQKDGSGRQTNLRDAVLSPKQRSKTVKPNKDLTYVELPQSVDLTDGSGCGKFRYICSELRKFNPTPDFQLQDRYKLSRRGCAQVTCKPRDDETTPTVQFASVQPTPVTLFIGEKIDVTTDVDVKFNEENTDPNTAGINLWQMALWFSKEEDGSGKTTGYVETVLNEAQGEKPVDFNEFLMEQLPITADLREAIGCSKYRYICARIRKDSPEPDYELVGKSLESRTGCAPVECQTRSPDGQKLEIVSTIPTPVTIYRNERNDVTTDVTVHFDNDYGVSGKKLWQMSLWFSKSPLGAGKKTNLRESTLLGSQRNEPLTIEDDLFFEGLPQSVDLSLGQACGKFKYICAEIRKLEPEPDFDYTLKKKNSPMGCAKVTCIDRARSTPTVEFKSVQPTPVTLVIGKNNEVSTDVTIGFEQETTDDDVSGKNLWGLSVWFSKAKDGAGSVTGMVESALNSGQKKQPVDFGDFEFTDLSMTVDLTQAIGCGKYRFICAKIRKGDPVPNYDLIGSKTVTGCAPVTCEKPPEEEEDPLIIVSTTITPVTLFLGEPNTVFPDVTVQFEGEEGVSGTNLWEMEIYFNKNGDGSGKKTAPTESTLTRNQRNQPLVITEDLVFTGIEKDVDLSDVDGCGKYKFICAVIRKNSPSPPFEFERKKPSSIKGCAKTSCEARMDEEPEVQFASTQPSAVTIYEEELNIVNTDVLVTFNELITDESVAGSNLWQMQLWFSKAANGQGSSIGTIESALSEEQADQPVSFSDFSFDALEARADLTTTGCNKYQYICARVRKDKPDPSYELVGKDPAAVTGCAPVTCERGRDPTVEFASVQTTPVTVYEESVTPVTTTVTVTFNEPRTDQVSGSGLWQMDLWFSKAKDGAGSSSDGVTNVLSAAQGSKPVNFRNFVFSDLEITADLSTGSGCGKYRFICAQIRRDDPEPTYKLLGKAREATVGCAPVTCDKSQEPTVQFASVSVTPVAIYEEQENPVTTDVTITFDEPNTDESVAGSGLWQVDLWFSKAADGQGSSSDRVENVLSASHGSKPVNFNNFVFEDLEITADLTATGCGKYRYLCAHIRRDDPDPSYNLLDRTIATTVGCAEITCERSQLPVVIVSSVTNTPVQIFPEQVNDVTTDVTITFDRSSELLSGSNLWRLETWYSKDANGVGSRYAETDQALTSAQASESLGSRYRFQFNGVTAEADLTVLGCGKFLHVCNRIKKHDGADPDYDLQGDNAAITGCSPVECGEPPRPTPHIIPTDLTVTPTSVVIGQSNTIQVTVTVNFDPTSDEVDGSNLWRVIVWLSNNDDGVTGSRVGETDQTITASQGDMSFRPGRPLNFRNVQVDMNLSGERNCKRIAFVCARLKKNAPDPKYTIAPSQVTGCAPCSCGA